LDSLLNDQRPPVFCPGCSHEHITRTLDKALQKLGLAGNQVVIVSDIGCSGLFDTFFHTHAMHGLHGRALTYATGLKMAQPDSTVVVTMGDGGQGIGGAHLLAACRRNLDITLLILNNFNFGMTGGQFSSTTPTTAQVGSGFLNRLERPLDICQVAQSAGAPYVDRCSAFDKNLVNKIQRAIKYEGFAVIDIWGICPGRYTTKNRLTAKLIDEALSQLPPQEGIVSENVRPEYSRHYHKLARGQKSIPPLQIEITCDPPQAGRQEVVLLGNAGQRIITAGEIMCLAGLSAGLNVTQKNEYNVTVLRGPSISELILSPDEIDYTGIERPKVIVALGQQGVDHRKNQFEHLDRDDLILQINDVNVPPCKAHILRFDFKNQGIKRSDWALASLVAIAKLRKVISPEMLQLALEIRFKGKALQTALEMVDQLRAEP
jgi:pyruvate/2-oxoacid:ferredoxin oxidoreductase beta subunit/Pyruvate/2-oxoacid:ferredoxin oxidoreductase gamma subunit